MVQISILLWMVSIIIIFYGHGQVSNRPIFCRSRFLLLLLFPLELCDSLLSIIIVRYYVEPPCIVICGQLSASLAEKLEKDEKARIAARVECLGPDGLKKAEAELEAAKAEHEQAVPTELITSFPMPDVKNIFWHPVQSLQEPGNGRKPVHRAFESSSLSKYIELDGKPLSFLWNMIMWRSAPKFYFPPTRL